MTKAGERLLQAAAEVRAMARGDADSATPTVPASTGSDAHAIRTDEEHHAALAEVDRLWGAAIGTPQGCRLDVLVAAIEAYEARRWPIGQASSD